MSVSVCVFCGARDGTGAAWLALARDFGAALATRGMTLVYGGGKVGLMGALADAVLDAGGAAVGVIPQFLRDREVAHAGLSELLFVDDLLERKALMIERSDAFVALPGGIGTYDELLEVIAWRQLRQLNKPIALLDHEQFFSPFMQMLDRSISAGFLTAQEIEHLIIESDTAPLLDRLAQPSAQGTPPA